MKSKLSKIIVLAIGISLLSLATINGIQVTSVSNATSKTPCLDKMWKSINSTFSDDTPEKKKSDLAYFHKSLRTYTEANCIKETTSKTPCLDQNKAMFDATMKYDNSIDIAKHKLYLKTTSEANCRKERILLNKQVDKLLIVEADVKLIYNNILSVLGDYDSLGTTSGSITLSHIAKGVGSSESLLTFSKMNNAHNTNFPSTVGPEITNIKIKLSPGSSIYSANYGAGSSGDFCVVVVNNFSYVKLTFKSLSAFPQISLKTPITCHDGI